MKLNRVFDPSCPALAMEPQAAERWYAILFRAIKGEIELSDVRAAMGLRSSEKAPYQVIDGVACISINGSIVRGEEDDDDYWGLCSVDGLRRKTLAAMNDAAVKCIAYDVDSPGGTVRGVNELAGIIRQARAAKPTGAYTNGMMCSAAYWLGCQADMIQCSDDSMLGSIGVYSVMYDRSEQAKMDGIKVCVVKAGAMKGAGTPGTPITDEQLAESQKVVNKFYGMFVDGVAQGRKIAADAAGALADGRVYLGADAVAAKLADAVGSFDDFMGALRARSTQNPQARGLQYQGVQAMTKEEEDKAKADARAEERARVSAINAAFPKHAAFANKMIAEGKTLIEAKGEFGDVIAAESAAKDAEIATLKTAKSGAGNKLIETGAPNANGAGSARAQFDAAVKAMTDLGIQKLVAVQRVIVKNPDLHRALLLEANKKKSVVKAYFDPDDDDDAAAE